MPVPLHALPNDRTVEHVESRKQRRRPMAFVVMGHCPTAPFFQRQSWLRAIQRLNLGLFIERQNHGMSRWVNIQTNDQQLRGASRQTSCRSTM